MPVNSDIVFVNYSKRNENEHSLKIPFKFHHHYLFLISTAINLVYRSDKDDKLGGGGGDAFKIQTMTFPLNCLILTGNHEGCSESIESTQKCPSQSDKF